MAAVGAGAGGDEDRSEGREVAELLYARSEAIGEERGAGGGGAEAGGDMLVEAAALASGARRMK